MYTVYSYLPRLGIFNIYLMQTRFRMVTRILLGLGLGGIVGSSHAQESDIPDISAEALSSIGRELECGRTTAPNAVLGCEILAQFSAAGSPDPKNFKTSAVAGSRRWIGVTII